MNNLGQAGSTKAEMGEWLSLFKIELTSLNPSVYRNGRQQVEVTLQVEAVKPEGITTPQFESLKIVYLKDNGQYEALPEEQTDDFDWFASLTRDEHFDYYVDPSQPMPASEREPESEGLKKTTISKKFYVGTVASAGSLIELYARIEMAADAIFVTTGTNESNITLSSLPLPRHTYPEDYTWKNSWSDGSPPQEVFIQEWSLYANNPGFSYAVVQLGNPNGMIKWQRKELGVTSASNVGVAYPGKTNVLYNPFIELGEDFAERKHKTIKSTVTDQVVVVLQADNKIPYYSAEPPQEGPTRVLAYDRYGNSHVLEFSFGTEGSDFQRRTTLVVNVSSPAQAFNCAVGCKKDEQ